MNELTSLGAKLRSIFEATSAERQQMELKWLEDLRQVRGIYEPEEVARFKGNQSTGYTRMTRTKVKSATARLMDMVFPAGTEDNWSLSPSPVPEVPISPQILAAFMQTLGRQPTQHDILVLKKTIAEDRAKNMEMEIRDQLAAIKYRKILRNVINSGNIFGTGLLKGPLVNSAPKKSWVFNGQAWVPAQVPKNLPFVEFTPVWEAYPDMTATEFEEASFVFQRTVNNKKRLLELAARPDFNGEVIKRYLEENREGDCNMLHWEIALREIGLNLTNNFVGAKNYQLLEYWGPICLEDLEGLDVDLPDDAPDEFWGNAWLLGPEVIKMEVQPLENTEVPFYAYYWDKDETSIWGEGIPAVIRDDQKGLNAANRAAQDHAAAVAGPQIEANVDLIQDTQNIHEVYPFKVWLREGVGMEAQYPAIRLHELQSHVQELMSLGDRFANNIHEATLPSYMHGEGVSKGSVGRTSSGLSMLMSAAQIVFKDQLFSLDDGIQRPFLTAMYHWNMQFNPREDIKGDFEVQVKGTSSLVAREIRATNLNDFAISTQNEFDAPFVDRQALLKERALVLELSHAIVKSEDQQTTNLTTQVTNYGQPTPTQSPAVPGGPGPNSGVPSGEPSAALAPPVGGEAGSIA